VGLVRKLRIVKLLLAVVGALVVAALNGSGPWPP
jgi:hypothetical protein